MKPQLPIVTLTKMTKKNIKKNTWHQRNQFKHKFQRVVRCYNFFFKRVILTQNSTYCMIPEQMLLLNVVNCCSSIVFSTCVKHSFTSFCSSVSTFSLNSNVRHQSLGHRYVKVCRQVLNMCIFSLNKSP